MTNHKRAKALKRHKRIVKAQNVAGGKFSKQQEPIPQRRKRVVVLRPVTAAELDGLKKSGKEEGNEL